MGQCFRWMVLFLLYISQHGCTNRYCGHNFDKLGFPKQLYSKQKQLTDLKLSGRMKDIQCLQDQLTRLEIDSATFGLPGRFPANLQTAVLSGGHLQDLEKLVIAKETLQTLVMMGNQEGLDLQALSVFTKLAELRIENTNIQGTPNWAELTDLKDLFLDAAHKRISLTGLNKLNLKNLTLANFDFAQLPPLPTSLTGLALTDNDQIPKSLSKFKTGPKTLRGLPPKLTHLHIRQQGFRIDMLPEHNRLESLTLEGIVRFDDLAPLAQKFPNLRVLRLIDFHGKTLEGMEILDLSELHLTDSDALTTLSFLSSLSTEKKGKLKRLTLSGCYSLLPEAFAILASFKNLTHLNIERSLLTDLDLKGMILSSLTLEENNQLSNLTLIGCKTLRELKLLNNDELTTIGSIEDLPPLEHVTWQGRHDLGLGLIDSGEKIFLEFKANQCQELTTTHLKEIQIIYDQLCEGPKPYRYLMKLADFPYLSKLTLDNVAIENLIPLKDMKNLEVLDLRKAEVHSLEGLPASVISLGVRSK